MTKEQIHALAERIADALFTSEFGHEAVILQLYINGYGTDGGWSRSAAVERIAAVIEKEAKS